MPSYREAQEERDKALANRSANTADNFSLYLKTWIQEEIRALFPRVNQLADSPTAPIQLKRDYEQARENIQELNSHELNDIYDIFTEKLKEIQDGVYNNGLDAHQYVQDALSGLERVVRRLLRIRKEVDFWMEPLDSEDKGTEGATESS